jgi:hypothetical protein
MFFSLFSSPRSKIQLRGISHRQSRRGFCRAEGHGASPRAFGESAFLLIEPPDTPKVGDLAILA